MKRMKTLPAAVSYKCRALYETHLKDEEAEAEILTLRTGGGQMFLLLFFFM